QHLLCDQHSAPSTQHFALTTHHLALSTLHYPNPHFVNFCKLQARFSGLGCFPVVICPTLESNSLKNSPEIFCCTCSDYLFFEEKTMRYLRVCLGTLAFCLLLLSTVTGIFAQCG